MFRILSVSKNERRVLGSLKGLPWRIKRRILVQILYQILCAFLSMFVVLLLLWLILYRGLAGQLLVSETLYELALAKCRHIPIDGRSWSIFGDCSLLYLHSVVHFSLGDVLRLIYLNALVLDHFFLFLLFLSVLFSLLGEIVWVVGDIRNSSRFEVFSISVSLIDLLFLIILRVGSIRSRVSDPFLHSRLIYL